MTYNIPRGKVRKFVAGELEVSPDNSITTHGLKVDAQGNVGIGTRTPTEKLDVVGALTVDGKVGINSTSPNTSIQIGTDLGKTDDASTSRVTIGNTNTYYGMGVDYSNRGWVGYTNGSYLEIGTVQGGVTYDNTIVVDKGKIAFGYGTTNNFYGYGRFEFHQSSEDSNGGLSVVNFGGERSVRIFGDSSNTARIESGETGAGKLTLNSGGGGVGINTTNTAGQEVLRVKGTGDNFNTLVVMGKDESTEYVSLGVNSSGWPTVAGGYVGSSGASRLAFATQAGGGSAESIKMCIHPSGQLSLGATNIGSGEKVRIIGTGDNFNTLVVFGQDSSTEYIGMGVKSGVPTLTGGYSGTGDAGLAFQTSDSAETERMRITAEGDILMGDYSGNARTWADVSFASHWGNYGGAFYSTSYRKDGLGNVLLRGLIKCTNSSAGYTVTNPIFTLPSGYRPARTCIFHIAAHHGGARKTVEIRIDTAGKLFLLADDPSLNDWFSVEGIRFSLDAD